MLRIFIRRTKAGQARPRWGIIITVTLALYLLVRVIGVMVDPHLEIKGDVAYKQLVFDSEIRYLDVVAIKSAETIYSIADKYKQINKVVISLYIKEWHSRRNRRGSAWSEEIPVGQIVIENLAEVRQYKNAQEYASAKSNFYKSEIKKADGARHFY